MKKQFRKGWKWYVYVIECEDGLYYTGMTWCIENRVDQHLQGYGSRFTRKHGVNKLRYVEEFDNFEETREAEKILKDYSREKKEALFNCEVDLKKRK